MNEFYWSIAELGWDCFWQSTLCLALGGGLSLLLARRPARAHGVLVAAMIAALAAPVGSLVIREFGWGLLSAEAILETKEPAVAVVAPRVDARPQSVAANRRAEVESPDEMLAAGRAMPDSRAGSATVGRRDASAGQIAEPAAVADPAKSHWDWIAIGRPFLAGWIVLSLLALTRLAASFGAGMRLVGRAKAVDDSRLNAAMALAAERLGISTAAELRVSGNLRCPMIWCWSRRPVVLVPTAFVRAASETTLLTVFAHELAHWKRRDHFALFLGQVLCSLLPWHPLAWWVRRRHEDLSELACDEWVVATGHLPETYAEALIDLVPQRRPVLALAVVRSRSGLRGRIEYILGIQVARPRLGAGWLGGLAALTIALVSVVALAQQKPPVAESKRAASKEPKTAKPNADVVRDGLLKVSGTVLLADGSPAAGATVISRLKDTNSPVVVQTDQAGRFTLHALCGNRTLQIASADGSQQVVHQVPSLSPSEYREPITIKLAPAAAQKVVVRAEEKPVAGARVALAGYGCEVFGVTAADGSTELKYPAGEELQHVAAWHPTLGVGGIFGRQGLPNVDMGEISLLPPAPHVLHVVDREGKGIAGLNVSVSFRTGEDGWIATDEIDAARVRTDETGTATLPWAPAEDLRNLEVNLVDADWKVDSLDFDATARETTVHACAKATVAGKITLPDGSSAEGILITGFGFGPGNNGDVPFARAERDGSFKISVAADHGYGLGIVDDEWVGPAWTGIPFCTDGEESDKIAIAAYPATPLNVQVTRGPDHTPVANASVSTKYGGASVKYRAPDKKGNGHYELGSWTRTDDEGRIKVAVGTGEVRVDVTTGNWEEERTINVTSAEPVDLEFHRAWLGERQLTGRLTLDGQPYRPGANLWARASAPGVPFLGKAIEPRVAADGTFQVDFDTENLNLLVIDRERGYSGLAKVGTEAKTADVVMQPTATFGGTLVDENQKPLAGHMVRMRLAAVKVHRGNMIFFTAALPDDEPVVTAGPTDAEGKFQLSAIPVGVEMEMIAEGKMPEIDRSMIGRHLMFEPGEKRPDAVFTPEYRPAPRPSQAAVPLAMNAAKVCRSASLSHMLPLAVLRGDDSSAVMELANRILDFQKFPVVLNYSPLDVKAEQVASEAKTIAHYGWPMPAAGEVVLVVLNDEKKPIASQTLAVSDADVVMEAAKGFLTANKLPARDAQQLVAEGRKAAAESSRRLWIVEGGPRCGPCFTLARWMDDHRAVLEKDFVIVKLMGNLDEHFDVVMKELRPSGYGGVPWYAITEADGKIVATSDGPLGNIGNPSTLEDIRYFRQMLERSVQHLTPAEVTELVDSLEPKR